MTKIHESISMLSVRIHKVTLQDVVEAFDQYINEGTPRIVVSLGINLINIAQRDEELREIIWNSSLVCADSRPVVYASRFLGKPLPENIAGSDLLPFYCGIALKRGYKIFLLGAAEKVAERTGHILVQQNPGLHIVGYYSPPLGFEHDPEENRKIIAMIRAVQPDVLFVCLGNPKQEKWIAQNMNSYDVPVSMGIGSSFDYIGGNLKRAPKWMNRFCLEWFYRLLHEPRRLWRRYLIGNPYFIVLVVKEKLSRRIKGLPRGLGGSENEVR